jgi:hypothetical protein
MSDIEPQQAASPTDGMDTEAKKSFWTNVLYKLVESRRFLEFLDANYVIGVHKNDEDKTVDVLVTEKPVSVGPKLAGDQIFKIQAACLKAGARDTAALVKSIMSVLGQEESLIIGISSDVAVQNGIDHDLLKSKLDV